VVDLAATGNRLDTVAALFGVAHPATYPGLLNSLNLGGLTPLLTQAAAKMGSLATVPSVITAVAELNLSHLAGLFASDTSISAIITVAESIDLTVAARRIDSGIAATVPAVRDALIGITNLADAQARLGASAATIVRVADAAAGLALSHLATLFASAANVPAIITAANGVTTGDLASAGALFGIVNTNIQQLVAAAAAGRDIACRRVLTEQNFPSLPVAGRQYTYEVAEQGFFLQNTLDLSKGYFFKGGRLDISGINPGAIDMSHAIILSDAVVIGSLSNLRQLNAIRGTIGTGNTIAFPNSLTQANLTEATILSRLTFGNGTTLIFNGVTFDSGDGNMRKDIGSSRCYINLTGRNTATSLALLPSAALVNGEIDIRNASGEISLADVHWGRMGRLDLGGGVTSIVTPDGVLECYLDLSQASQISVTEFLGSVSRAVAGLGLSSRLGAASSLDISGVEFGARAALCLAQNASLESVSFKDDQTLEGFLMARDIDPASTIITRTIDLTGTNFSELSLVGVTRIEGSIYFQEGRAKTVTGGGNWIQVGRYADISMNRVAGAGRLRLKITGQQDRKIDFYSVSGFEELCVDMSDALFTDGSRLHFEGAANFKGHVSVNTFQNLNGLFYINFLNCTGLRGGLNFPSVTVLNSTISYLNFQGCTGLSGTAPTFPVLVSILNGTLSFQGCTGLTDSPEFPVLTNLSGSTLSFQGCTGLNGAAPDFSELINSGTINFQGCTGLNGAAPDFSKLINLSGTITFQGCVGLTGAPEFPVLTNLSNSAIIFQGCTGLTEVPVFQELRNISNGGSGINFMGCTGMIGEAPTFPNLMTTGTNSHNAFPTINFSGCIGLTGAPSFPVLQSGNININFSGCTGLDGTAPTFPLLTNVSAAGGEEGINFRDCTGLTGVPSFPALVSLNSGSITFQNCTGLTGILSFLALTNLQNLNGRSGSINFKGCTGLTGVSTFSSLQSMVGPGGIDFTGCIGMSGEAPAFPCLTISSNNYGIPTINFSGLAGLTGAPSFPALQGSAININFNGCTGLNGTVVFAALQAIDGGINFSGCTSLAGVRLNNCNVSAANWSRFNFTNTGIATADFSDSTLSGTLDMRSLTNLTTLILTGCTGTSELKLHTSRQELVNIIEATDDITITYQ
jgi:hypothetical protein